MTVGGREFYVYRYEGKLNDIPNAAVILSYPKEAFGNPRALRVFISTNAELSTQEILDTYSRRWPIELFFRQSKGKLALDKYQIRSRKGIRRYWLIMSLVHYLCCMHSEQYCTFEDPECQIIVSIVDVVEPICMVVRSFISTVQSFNHLFEWTMFCRDKEVGHYHHF